jgi:hypothetical protein
MYIKLDSINDQVVILLYYFIFFSYYDCSFIATVLELPSISN